MRYRRYGNPKEARFERHGLQKTSEWTAWSLMKGRCYNLNHKNYSRYGGRGITVCDEWRDSFLAFYNHIGPKPSPQHSLNRIDNNGNYEPGNVEWADPITQANNKCNNVRLTYDGQTHTVPEWARIVGVPYTVFYSRIKRGSWDLNRFMSHK